MEPQVGLFTGHGACLEFSLSLSPSSLPLLKKKKKNCLKISTGIRNVKDLLAFCKAKIKK